MSLSGYLLRVMIVFSFSYVAGAVGTRGRDWVPFAAAYGIAAWTAWDWRRWRTP